MKGLLFVLLTVFLLGWWFFDPPEDKPVPQSSIAIHSAAPDRVIIEP